MLSSMPEFLGIGGFLLWLVLAIVSLPTLGLALVRTAQTKSEATLTEGTEARRSYRRWAVIAVLSGILFLGATGLVVFIYLSCVGEC